MTNEEDDRIDAEIVDRDLTADLLTMAEQTIPDLDVERRVTALEAARDAELGFDLARIDAELAAQTPVEPTTPDPVLDAFGPRLALFPDLEQEFRRAERMEAARDALREASEARK